MTTAPASAANPPLAPTPEPPACVKRLMLAIAIAVDGYVDQCPDQWHPALKHSLLIPNADVVVAGTRCSPPLLVREVGNIAAAVERDAIIVRAASDPKHASFDVILRGATEPFLAYRLWIRQPMGAAWLVPPGSEATHIRLDALGLEPSREPPFVDEFDRYRGLKAGSEFLSVAVGGWF